MSSDTKLSAPSGQRKYQELENLAAIRERIWDLYVVARRTSREFHRDPGRMCPTDKGRVMRISGGLADLIQDLDKIVPRDVGPYMPKHRTAVDEEQADRRLAENKECV